MMQLLQNNRVSLRAMEPEDLELLYTIETQRCEWNTGTCGIPYSRYALKEFLLEQTSDIFKSHQLRLVIDDEFGKSVGMVDLYDFEPLSRRAEVGIALLKGKEGKGYGRKALALLIDYVKNTLQMHQLYAYVDKDNQISKSLFTSLGFKPIAEFTDWTYSEGHYRDAVFFRLFL